MSDYNPRRPQNLGNEWCPIRDEDIAFSPAVNALELGSGFTLQTARTLQEGRFYLHDWPPGAALGQTFSIAVYPRDTEDQSGPVRRVVIPCNAGATTGAAGTGLSGGALTFADAVDDPSDSKKLAIVGDGSTFGGFTSFYAVNQYTQQLLGKRILGVALLYVASTNTFLDDLTQGNLASVQMSISSDLLSFGDVTYGTISNGGLVMAEDTNFPSIGIQRMPFGEMDPFWSTTLSPDLTSDRMPWTTANLQRFEQSATNRHPVYLLMTGSTLGTMSFHYLALEILYCEEQRVAVGGRSFGVATSTVGRYTALTMGANPIPLRSLNLSANPVLAAGDYTVVLSSADRGMEVSASGPSGIGFINATQYPELNALRELFSLPTLPGLQVNLPFPATEAIVGRTLEAVQSHVLPQVTLHTSGGPLTEVHVYGRQAAIPVYGSTYFARQGILESGPTAVPTYYPQARFWARRFGDTTVPLTLSAQTAVQPISAQITPDQFDALPEILDGWKQIDLTFTGATPSFTNAATARPYEWRAPGETAGNRWEVLGAIAPAISGVPGNLLQLAPAPHQLDTATYGGSTAFLGWVAPIVTAFANDTTADAVVIFAQNMPTVTELAVGAGSQPVSGIGLDCGLTPGCVPSAILYNAVTWTGINGGALDAFTRTTVAGFGTATSGEVYTLSGTAADFATNGTQGVITPSVQSSDRIATIVVGGSDHDVRVDFVVSSLPAGNDLRAGVVTRFIDASNFYYAEAFIASTGAVTLRYVKVVAGVVTVIATPATIFFDSIVGTSFTIRATAAATRVMAKIWPTSQPEPSQWLVDTVDASITTGTSVGVFARNDHTVLTYSVTFDNLYSQPFGFGYLELQRMDTVDTTWRTIMQGTDASDVGFNDYEARVGIVSSYRIRMCDSLAFCGLWSTTATGTVAAPGVTVGGDGTGVLIFTSNAHQDGRDNLAYTQGWESGIEEVVQLPEADTVKLQNMYNRDFPIAFRPLERGGERFTRTLLVQAAAIAAPVLENAFHSLRDMAWDTVPYICVRDELGDRWFATILVPEGTVRRNRRLQLVTVQVVETTDTPAAVDPAIP